jgi:hypothetical protein
MGFSHSWVAVRGCSPAAVIEALGFEETGDTDPVLPGRLGVAELPGGWTILVSADFDGAFKKWAPALVALGREAVACAEEEHVMYAEARGYDAGAESWRVVRDCTKEPFSYVEVTGAPPPQFEGIRTKAFAQQAAEGGDDAGVDMIFEIPPQLAHSVCGFRLGEDPPEGVVFAELRRKRSPGLLQRLFSKR